MTPHILDTLRSRGFIHQVSDEAGLRARLEEPCTFYIGYDATARSLTAGHLVSIMLAAHLQRAGHRPIILMGGGTTQVGDPTGKSAARPLLSESEIERNLGGMKAQFARFLDFSAAGALMVDNATWLRGLSLLRFLREIGVHFGINELLHLEAYRTRLDEGGLSFLEFSYALLQAYDFLHLYREHGCILQAGGSDQWGNSLAGLDLIRRVTGGEAFVLVTPLLVTASGTKMGKTERGAVWLDESLTTPYDYFQYWRNTDDRDVERFLGLFTFLPLEEVRRLCACSGAELNRAKEVLAFEATCLLHGEEAARDAREAARAAFAGGDAVDALPSVRLTREQIRQGMSLTELFVMAGLTSSRNEARRLIRQNGLSIDGVTVGEEVLLLDPAVQTRESLLLSRGAKRHCRVVLQDEDEVAFAVHSGSGKV